MFVSLDIIINH